MSTTAPIATLHCASQTARSAALEDLYYLNRLFLDTVASSTPRRYGSSATPSLPDKIATGIARLTSEHRSALARSCYAFFDAQFSNGSFWTQLTSAVREPSVPPAISGDVTSIKLFNQLALFYAWHLVRTAPYEARVLLGMAKQTRQVFAQLSLSHIQQLALAQPSLITPRWQDRATVWQIILGAAHKGPNHLAELRMLGIHLIAGDLSLSEG